MLSALGVVPALTKLVKTVIVLIFLIVTLLVLYFVAGPLTAVFGTFTFALIYLIWFLSPGFVAGHRWLWLLPFLTAFIGFIGDKLPRYLNLTASGLSFDSNAFGRSVPTWLVLGILVFAVVLVVISVVGGKKHRKRKHH